MSEEKRLVGAQELRQKLNQPDWVIFDVRHDLMDHRAGRQQYVKSHIPGAYFLDNEAELVSPMTGSNGRHPLPDLAKFTQLMTQYGLHKDSCIVVYDASQGHLAARTWWLLKWAGFEHVMILDGGWQAWLESNGATEAHLSLPPVPPTRLATDSAQQPQLKTVSADDIVSQLNEAASSCYTLVDARSAERYRGEKEPIDPVAGRIPSAINRPTPQNLQADGRFKPAAQLNAEFMELLGDVDPAHVVHYCGSGMTACHNLFAMELAGLSGSCIYPGSWSEWIADPSRPREVSK